MAFIGKAYILMYFSNIKKSLTKHYIFLQLSKDLDRVDKERKEGLQKIQAMHSEIKDLKVKLSDFELNKTKDIKKLQDSLTESLKSNKKVQELVDAEKSKIQGLEDSKTTLETEIQAFKKEKLKVETEAKNLNRY